MNLRKATLFQRQRKNIKFEQERTASLDSDLQRSGGVKTEKPAKKSEQKSPTKKS